MLLATVWFPGGIHQAISQGGRGSWRGSNVCLVDGRAAPYLPAHTE
jgi:hypothetical protein